MAAAVPTAVRDLRPFRQGRFVSALGMAVVGGLRGHAVRRRLIGQEGLPMVRFRRQQAIALPRTGGSKIEAPTFHPKSATGALAMEFVIPSTANLALFVSAALVLLVIPGPAVLFIIAQSVEQGRKAGLVSDLGIHTATLVHVVAAALGLSALLASSA